MDSPTSSVPSVQSQGDSPKAVLTADAKRDVKQEGSLKQAAGLCQKRACKSVTRNHRHMPYDRSPGGSTCTSSDESTAEDVEPVIEQKREKRMAANSRERKRMHTVNSAFDQLRELVPTYPSNRKLSKIDTLRLACAYIEDLTSLVRNPQVVQGDDVKLYHPHCQEGFLQGSVSPTCGSPPMYPGVHVKTEYGTTGEFSPCGYQHYRVQPSYFSVSSTWLKLNCMQR